MDRRAFIGGLLATTAFPLTSDDHGFTRLELAGWRIVGPVHSAQYEWVELPTALIAIRRRSSANKTRA